MQRFNIDHTSTAYSAVNAFWLGQAAKLAYSSEQDIATTTASWGLTNFEFFDGKRTNTQAYVAGNQDLIVVAFRGTEGKLEDWLTDAKIRLVDEVHRGFKEGVDEIWPHMADAINRFIGSRLSVAEAAMSPENPKPPGVWYTGHSLGGALAALAAANMQRQGVPVDGLYTFGQPRTGSPAWAKELERHFNLFAFRHVNNNDLVTRVPPRSFNYRHVGCLRYFDADGNLHDDIGWWNRFLDRVKGRLDDFMQLHTDGIKDHAMEKYLACLERHLPQDS